MLKSFHKWLRLDCHRKTNDKRFRRRESSTRVCKTNDDQSRGSAISVKTRDSRGGEGGEKQMTV